MKPKWKRIEKKRLKVQTSTENQIKNTQEKEAMIFIFGNIRVLTTTYY